MKSLTFWFDPISPFAYLAFEQLPQVLQGVSYEVRYRPVLFAGLLGHWGQKGPAEIEPKRAWTFLHVLWLARQRGIPMQMPAMHPFNPLALLRLAVACAPAVGTSGRGTSASGTPSRLVCERILRHVWQGGLDPQDPQRLAELTSSLAPPRDPQGADVKQQLRDATDEAIALGLFGVPTITAGDKLFWGVDSLEMLAQCLRGDPMFDAGDWATAGQSRPGVHRPA